jgi:hypothetical protein
MQAKNLDWSPWNLPLKMAGHARRAAMLNFGSYVLDVLDAI